MFFIQSDLTIQSALSLKDIANKVSDALNIPQMVEDRSGKYEDVLVFSSSCFGLEFTIGRTDSDPVGTYQLAIFSDVDAFDYDGTENEVDATKYILLMLKKSNIFASPRADNLLY